jgi:hypothetical protein
MKQTLSRRNLVLACDRNCALLVGFRLRSYNLGILFTQKGAAKAGQMEARKLGYSGKSGEAN